jgi:hypothetical protein
MAKQKMVVYLAGRMGRDPADEAWRQDLTPFLESLGFEVLNPCEFEPRQLRGLKLKRLPEGMSHWTELQHSEDSRQVERFLRYMRHVISFDIKLVRSQVNYVVCRWSEGCKTGAGTHSELTEAFMNGVPVYCVEEASLPAWSRGCCTEVFKTFDELKEFLTEEFGEQ